MWRRASDGGTPVEVKCIGVGVSRGVDLSSPSLLTPLPPPPCSIDTESGDKVCAMTTLETISSMAFAHDSPLPLLVTDHQREVLVWDLKRRDVIRRFHRHTSVVSAVAISPSGTMVGAGSKSGVVRHIFLSSSFHDSLLPRVASVFVVALHFPPIFPQSFFVSWNVCPLRFDSGISMHVNWCALPLDIEP